MQYGDWVSMKTIIFIIINNNCYYKEGILGDKKGQEHFTYGN